VSLSKSLLLISSRPEDQVFAAEIAIATGLSLKHVQDFKEGALLISRDEAQVILVDIPGEKEYEVFETAIQETVGLFSDKINSNAIHYLSSEELEKVQYLIQSPLFGHFIMRNLSNPKESGQHYGRIVRATLQEKAFGLSHLLKPGTKVQVIKLSLSSQKSNAVEAIKVYLLAAKFQSRMATVISNAVDELLMNSIFDAPVDDIGKSVLGATPRSTLLKLEGRNAVELHIGFDGQYVAISAIDFFGSLDKLKLLSHISKIYVKDEYKVRTSTAGAGIGLATVFRSGGSFFFVSESRVQTEVTVFFRKTDNFREFKDQFKFISTQFYF
jgi:hypothetical protein